MKVRGINQSICSGNTYITSVDWNFDGDIGEHAFEGCKKLGSININGAVSSIGEYAFRGCSSLYGITIPKSINTIGDYSFNDCENVSYVVIDDRENVLNIGSIGNFQPLFNSCPLDSVYIGGRIKYEKISPFAQIETLRSVVISGNEIAISDGEFSGCSHLKNVLIGPQVVNIGKDAFSGCISVTNISCLAKTPPTCGDGALDDISKWDCTLAVPTGQISSYQGTEQWRDFFFIEEGAEHNIPTFAKVDGSYYHFDTYSKKAILYYAQNFKSDISIPSQITYYGSLYDVIAIGDYAFGACTDMTSVTIPESIVYIGDAAFDGCTGL